MTSRRGLALLGAVALVACASDSASAVERCSREEQNDVCRDANPSCPAAQAPFGVTPGSWPVFQHDVQHTGQSASNGPTCADVLWERRLLGQVLSALALAPGNPNEPESLFVPVGKAPLCALDPDDGTPYWCETDEVGKRPDRSSPAIGNGGHAFIGTRDNDMWAIEVPPIGVSPAGVAWRQKVCSDGDITVPPIIGDDGLIYMASDSLGAGTLMAMCPGAVRQPKWCANPVGGGIRNASPALSPAGDVLYVVVGAGALVAYQAQTGAELWRAQLEPRRSIGRNENLAPVVHPTTGRVYVGLRQGLWAVDPPALPGGTPATTLLFAIPTGYRMEAPPALDVPRNTIVFGASKGLANTLYAIGLNGTLKWQRSDLGRGRFQNNPPVIDASGRVYLALRRSLIALTVSGADLWRRELPGQLNASPILAAGRLYVGTTSGIVYAIGGC
ncbi:MAG: PQQ-binding-like beta-propeller repeat protein [Thermodesulfobacteriota bacterium]